MASFEQTLTGDLDALVLHLDSSISRSSVTAGGSQAMFFKLHPFGEEAFLKRAMEALDSFPR
jgi:hypothetical protein